MFFIRPTVPSVFTFTGVGILVLLKHPRFHIASIRLISLEFNILYRNVGIYEKFLYVGLEQLGI